MLEKNEIGFIFFELRQNFYYELIFCIFKYMFVLEKYLNNFLNYLYIFYKVLIDLLELS